MTGGKASTPKPNPDRVLRVSGRFLLHYPHSHEIVARTKALMEDDMAWVEVTTTDPNTEQESLVISCWYGSDVKASAAALDELSAALGKWDLMRGVRG